MGDMSMRWVLFALVSGCAGAANEPVEPATTNEPVAKAAPEPATPRSHEALVATVAREYKAWKLVDDEFHWAPGLCRAPVRGGQHLSKADGAAHDGKLFLLWALDIDRYASSVGWTDAKSRAPATPSRGALPGDVAQVLVKESFVAQERGGVNTGEHANMHPAMRDGKAFRPGDPIGLFVMVQLAGKSEGTDAGWIYGTVAPDGAVTSATDVGACRDCHSQRVSRLFGLPRPPAMGM
jgi:hypothetical protein